VSPRVSFSKPKDFAQALLKVALQSGIKARKKPINRFKHENDFYWLVPPSFGRPTFRKGKIYISRVEKCQFEVGLHVEKGFGPSARDAVYSKYKDKKYFLNKDWIWNSFLHDLQGPIFQKAVRKVERKTSTPIQLTIDAESYVRDPNSFKFRLSANTLFLKRREISTNINPKSMIDLVSMLRSLPCADWIWVDFYAGIPFDIVRKSEKQNIWNAEKVWEGAVSPWLPWFR